MKASPSPKPTFFASAGAFRSWLEKHAATGSELLLGFYRVGLGKKGITYPQALDEALCFGWIDGVRKRRNETSYTIRFTPRKAHSVWSLVNIKRVQELIRLGRMAPRGLEVFAAREEKRSGVYAYEAQRAGLGAGLEKRFRAEPDAWAFFAAQPPGYRRTASYWVTSAKRPETQLKRLQILITDSRAQRRIGLITLPSTKEKPAS